MEEEEARGERGARGSARNRGAVREKEGDGQLEVPIQRTIEEKTSIGAMRLWMGENQWFH